MSIPILMYHQIDVPPPRGTPLRGLTVAPQSFARQMACLKLLGYQGLSMRDLMPYLQGEKKARSWASPSTMATATTWSTHCLS